MELPTKSRLLVKEQGEAGFGGGHHRKGQKAKAKLTRVREGEPVGGAGDDSGDSPFSCASTQMCSLAPETMTAAEQG